MRRSRTATTALTALLGLGTIIGLALPAQAEAPATQNGTKIASAPGGGHPTGPIVGVPATTTTTTPKLGLPKAPPPPPDDDLDDKIGLPEQDDPPVDPQDFPNGDVLTDGGCQAPTHGPNPCDPDDDCDPVRPECRPIEDDCDSQPKGCPDIDTDDGGTDAGTDGGTHEGTTGSGTTGGGSTGGGDLPRTGAEIMTIAGAGAAITGIGALLRQLGRIGRKRTA